MVRETPDAATNHDFNFAYTTDYGQNWRQTSGEVVVKPILPTTQGIKVSTFRKTVNSSIRRRSVLAQRDGSTP
jgi:hypothetical protein